ncbi:hypothetical protein LMH87_001746 [Akanthomyces muscarius]|uniref:Short-chain dehydrogenase n=1 Tax=Akanthomyces muscarius TaxID=2231603 RepID=A0A9W8Q7E6_AKAMU|nr:hypothetical protein LMH87_001746 [Akanthomyces muscarius]KAJ4147206.1 hypothetical protein LMH87_001746 [Akanthomyces muscarius]
MPSKQMIQTSEAILEKHGAALKGKTILITGVAADSIAGELAVQLSTVGPKLLILSARSESRVEPIVAKIKEKDAAVETRFLKMDLADQSEIRRAVASLSDVEAIDHVALVAGLMGPPYSKTTDGVESQLAVNYVANFLLVNLLRGKIEKAGRGSSVVVVASSAVRGGKMNFEDVNFETPGSYKPIVAYGQSNAARVMFVKKLAPQLASKGVRAYSVDPGAVWSGLQRHFTDDDRAWIAKLRSSGGKLKDLDGREYDVPPWTSTSEGAATIITGMVDPTIEDSSGAFLHNNAVADEELHSHIVDENNWTKLWDLTENLIRV